ncbi:hypothetical protein CDO52_23400 [Nocardiopsis gilva YIM 90087]|uniref:Uncharacterized protein n=1 Tax=Nocardiopsis gilva YIM 90087 TaxID=1235441 RepID=A0A223SB14_9ACTN|nr:hypothetical protein [Nocardiopsis gilva]ASU85348.1 hypothetical protein CDO52_23400 [Nocardiopsis gilva YIM 90087]
MSSSTPPATPDLARAAWAEVEPIHTCIYFAPETAPTYQSIGMESLAQMYFASRGAPLGPVGPELVAATFYNFNPAVVRTVIPEAWSVASPDTLVRARLEIADKFLRRVLGEQTVRSPEMREAADLARTAAESAALHPHGRPLFAGHAGLPWPEDPHLVLWHAATLIREFRGDGHIALLQEAHIGPVEALVSSVATGKYSSELLLKSRRWSREDWDAAVARMVDRGLVEVDGEGEPSQTTEGKRFRDDLEARTDVLSLPAFEPLGADGCRRLVELVSPFAEAIRAQDLIPFTKKRS